MSWAETLKINSDVSKPLNELFNESLFIYASDNYIFFSDPKVGTTTYSKAEEITFGSKLTMNCSGAVRFVITATNLNANFDNKIRIYKNGSRYKTVILDSDSKDDIITGTTDINVNRGDIIELRFFVDNDIPSVTTGIKPISIEYKGFVGIGNPISAIEEE